MTADEWKPLCPDDLQYEDLQVAVSVRQSLLLCCDLLSARRRGFHWFGRSPRRDD